jgi:hypothetical protein
MGKKVFIVAMMLFVGLVGIANADKGIVESPMVAIGGVEVEGSECKITRDGACKLEMTVPETAVNCSVEIGDFSAGAYFSTTVYEVEDAELKVEEAACIPVDPATTLYVPYCYVTCDDGLAGIGEWVNGMTTFVEVE